MEINTLEIVVKLPKNNGGMNDCPFADYEYYTCSAISDDNPLCSNDWKKMPCWKKGCPLIDNKTVIVKLEK